MLSSSTTMASPSSTKTLTLRTRDGKDFTVAESVIEYSLTIKSMIEDDCASGIIPVPNVDSETLEKVIGYCTKHTDESVSAKELKEFDANFVEVSTDDLHDLLLAANYLNIGSLLDVLAEKIASLIRGRSVEEIREIFDITSDFTKEEEEKMNKENPWIL